MDEISAGRLAALADLALVYEVYNDEETGLEFAHGRNGFILYVTAHDGVLDPPTIDHVERCLKSAGWRHLRKDAVNVDHNLIRWVTLEFMRDPW